MSEGIIGHTDIGNSLKPGALLVASYFDEGLRFGTGIVLDASPEIPEKKGRKKITPGKPASITLRLVRVGEDRKLKLENTLHRWRDPRQTEYTLRWPNNDSEQKSVARWASVADKLTAERKAVAKARVDKPKKPKPLKPPRPKDTPNVFRAGSTKAAVAELLSDLKPHSLSSLVNKCKELGTTPNVLAHIFHDINALTEFEVLRDGKEVRISKKKTNRT